MGLFRFMLDGFVDIAAVSGNEVARERQANRKPEKKRKQRTYETFSGDDTETLDDSPLDEWYDI